MSGSKEIARAQELRAPGVAASVKPMINAHRRPRRSLQLGSGALGRSGER